MGRIPVSFYFIYDLSIQQICNLKFAYDWWFERRKQPLHQLSHNPCSFYNNVGLSFLSAWSVTCFARQWKWKYTRQKKKQLPYRGMPPQLSCFLLLKNGRSRPLFCWLLSFQGSSKTVESVHINFADDGIRTSDFRCRKRPLYQLCRTLLPNLPFLTQVAQNKSFDCDTSVWPDWAIFEPSFDKFSCKSSPNFMGYIK